MAGRIIVITGANGGLGRALAQDFAEHGDTVVLLGRTLAKVQEVADLIGEKAHAIECLISAPDSVRAAFAQIAEKYGHIDALINNAGVFQMTTLEEASDAKIIDAVMVNLAAPMFTARAAIPLMGKGAHIINVTSESVDVTLPHLIPYQATKAGVEQMGRDLNLELFDRGIRVTTVRAGQMIGPGMAGDYDMEAIGKFFTEATRRGHDLMARGQSQYASVVHVFRMIVDAPADLQIDTIRLQGRPTA